MLTAPRARHSAATEPVHGADRRSRYGLWVAATGSLALALVVGLPGPAALAATPSTRPLLVRSGEMPGFVVHGPLEFATGATQWVTHVDDESGARERKDAQTLRTAGFVAGAYENLHPKNGILNRAGGSSVLLFKTAIDAARDVAKQYSEGVAIQPKGAVINPFKVTINKARAFTAPGTGPSPASASNVYFSSGRCLFVIGDFIDGRHPNTASPVVAASKSVDKRVRNACR